MSETEETGASQAMSASLALVEAFHDAGYVVLPVDPTPEMIEAGQKVHRVDAALLREVYRAMICAS